MEVDVRIDHWQTRYPLRITGWTFTASSVVTVELRQGRHLGRGEASGVYYKGESCDTIKAQIEALRDELRRGLSRHELAERLPAGGARNALDCALWDLEAKHQCRPVWWLAGLPPPAPLATTYTLGADQPDAMVARARAFADARAIKIKLTGEEIDAERVRAVREARPDVWLAVDGNQGFTRQRLDQLISTLVDARVQLIEQPFTVGTEPLLADLKSPIPIAADESAQTADDIEALMDRFDVVNLKLDKTGGLTEGLTMARRARRAGLGVMVGNMTGTSLAMAPAHALGQLCDIVDLDGPLLLQTDRMPGVYYAAGCIHCPERVWGGAAATE